MLHTGYQVCLGVWVVLGFYRGVQYDIYTKSKYEKKSLYVNSICMGFLGGVAYFIPMLLPFTLYKELYRLEVNMRNLEKEKNSQDYYDIL